MAGLADLDARIAKMEQAREDIVTATREAHSVLKDLRHEMREARRLLEHGLKAKMEEELDEKLKPFVDEFLTGLKPEVDKIYDSIVDKMTALSNEAMYGNPEGTGTNIFDAMRKRVDQFVEIHREQQLIDLQRGT